MKLTKSLQKNIDALKKAIKSDDIVYFELTSGGAKYCVVYVDSITDKTMLGELLLHPVYEHKGATVLTLAKKIEVPGVKTAKNLDDFFPSLLKGYTVLLKDGDENALLCDLLSYPTRAVTEPPTSTVIKGPREGFNECLKTNISMLRRRIKIKEFTVEQSTLGRCSQTDICVCYVSSIVDKKIVRQVNERLKLIDIDGVPDSSYVGKMIVEHKTSMFKQVGSTEKPDITAQKILEGRVAILVDGSPLAITVPYLLVEDFQTAEDYYVNNYRANMQRVLRVISILTALLLPAVFVAAQLFHLQIIPLNFLLTIVNSVKGIPLSPSFEMFFTLLIFEILNEASVRMPRYVGMALSVVGALVLGDTAVKAGIVSTPTILIMALSGICLFTVPELVDSMSVLRLLFLVAAGTIGGYGIIIVIAFLVTYLCSLENFGVPFLAPYAPIVAGDLKDGLYIDFISNMNRRPKVLKSKNKVRLRIKDVRE